MKLRRKKKQDLGKEERIKSQKKKGKWRKMIEGWGEGAKKMREDSRNKNKIRRMSQQKKEKKRNIGGEEMKSE